MSDPHVPGAPEDVVVPDSLIARMVQEVFGAQGTEGAMPIPDSPPGMSMAAPTIENMMASAPAHTMAGFTPTAIMPTPDYYFLDLVAPRGEQVDSPDGEPGPRQVDTDGIRRDFPVLQQLIHGKPLVWLDNAATTQKPQSVIDAVSRYYEHDNSNVHRGAHTLAARATDAYEGAREKVQRFLGAGSSSECIFVRGATEAINLVAQSFGRQHVGAGDEILLTTLEHHANIVPWQMLAKEKGAVLRVVPIDDQGQILLDDYAALLSPRTRIVGLAHVSNALGTVLPLDVMIEMAHRYGAVTVIDGAQAVSHLPVNVRELDADFYALSGHKLFAPTGVGVLYGKEELLKAMPPWQGGGSMIRHVSFDATTYSEIPTKFEAGTPTIGDAVGLGAAIDYVNQLGMDRIARHEQELMAHLTETLGSIRGVRQIGTAPGKVGVGSFVVDWMDTQDLGRYLDTEGIAVRAGHHCAQPTMQRFGLDGTVRPSLALYNTHDEIDYLGRAIRRSKSGRP